MSRILRDEGFIKLAFACSVFAFLALVGICVISKASVKDADSDQKTLTILYTGQASGQIRSCNCTKFRYGGYGREATFVEQVRKEIPNMLILEGGDMVGQIRMEQERLKAKVTTQSLKAIKYDAVIPGEAEMSYGITGLDQLKSSSGVEFVLANVNNRETGKPVCDKPFIICNTPNGLRVAIIGVLTPKLFIRDPLDTPDMDATDPVASAKETVKEAKKSSDLTIVVAHTTSEEAKDIAKTSEADIVIHTHSTKRPFLPEKDGNTVDCPTETIGDCIFVENGARNGWSVGQLDLCIDNGKVSVAASKLKYLDRTFEEKPEIVKLFDEYNMAVKDLALRTKNELISQIEARMQERGVDISKRRQTPFAGGAVCAKCHQSEQEDWEKTRHAKAFASLEKTHQEYDPECVICHTTGATVKGAFINAKDTPDFENVQCEVCHGPGRSHADSPAKGYGETGEVTCRSCHTDEYNPDFDYDAMWKSIAHGKKSED